MLKSHSTLKKDELGVHMVPAQKSAEHKALKIFFASDMKRGLMNLVFIKAMNNETEWFQYLRNIFQNNWCEDRLFLVPETSLFWKEMLDWFDYIQYIFTCEDVFFFCSAAHHWQAVWKTSSGVRQNFMKGRQECFWKFSWELQNTKLHPAAWQNAESIQIHI